MKTLIICKLCNNVMIYKGKIEDTEENSIIKYKDMHYCEYCDSYDFTLTEDKS